MLYSICYSMIKQLTVVGKKQQKQQQNSQISAV